MYKLCSERKAFCSVEGLLPGSSETSGLLSKFPRAGASNLALCILHILFLLNVTLHMPALIRIRINGHRFQVDKAYVN